MRIRRSRAAILVLAILCLVTGVLSGAYPVYSENVSQKQSNTSSFLASGRIWIAGDSIAADHSYENEADYEVFVHGWGEMLGNDLTEDAEVFNKAISGQTAKFFTEEDNYRDIMEGIGEGDFLLIQFGHNDYKSAGSDHSTLPTETEGSYKWYLKNYYIDPALKAGAMPVLCTSVVCYQTDDDGMVLETQDQAKFAEAMRVLYREYQEQGVEIGLIDTYALTHSLLNADSHNIRSYYAIKYDKSGEGSTSVDHVHFSAKGADAIANIISKNLCLMYKDFNDRFSTQKAVDGGDGTKESPYLISSWLQFYQIMQEEERNTPETYYKLTADLMPQIQQREWTTAFYANLDGDGHTLTNPIGMTPDSVLDENYGVISNLNLEYHLLHTSQNLQAPFVRDNYGTISNCSASGDLLLHTFQKGAKERWECGVFANVNHEGGLIEQCHNGAKLTVYADVPQIYLGGIAGCNEGEIRDCDNTGELLLDSFEYEPKEALTYDQVVCCAGGIAGIVKQEDSIVSSESTKAPKCLTTLQSDRVIMLSDAITPVTQEALEEMLAGNTATPEPSAVPDTSTIPESSATPKPTELIKGDIDFDGKVTLKDAQLALRIFLQMVEPTEVQLKAADFDGNGKVGLGEVQTILRIFLKME